MKCFSGVKGRKGPRLFQKSCCCNTKSELCILKAMGSQWRTSLKRVTWWELLFQFSSVQLSCSVITDSLWHHTLQHARPPRPSPTPGIHSNSCLLSQWWPSNHLILYRPFLLPSVLPSIRVFSDESVLSISWPKYWSFSFSISPSNEYSGLISFGMDWLDLIEVQGTLKSLLQHHSSKASFLQCSAFFKIQRSHPYMTTGKTIALTR